MRSLGDEAALAAAHASARAFCAQTNFIKEIWLTPARVIALPGGEAMAVISSAHMIADAGTRNIIIDEIRDILESGAPQAAPSTVFNSYSRSERALLDGPQGAALIDYWRRWYNAQPVMVSPTGKVALQWGNGIRTVRNFAIFPAPVLDKVRAKAEAWKVTPFVVCLTIFSLAMARWSGMDRFPVRVLGDKRTALDLANTVGLMFCADALEIHAPPAQDFETTLRGIVVLRCLVGLAHSRSAFLGALLRAPRRGVPRFSGQRNSRRVQLLFGGHGARKIRTRTDRDKPSAWPPEIVKLDQVWPRRSSPIFLHLMDNGEDLSASLHFYQNVISDADQELFVGRLFQAFDETVGI